MALSRDEALLRSDIWWLLTGYYNDQGIVPNVFQIERMLDLIIQQLETE